MDSTEAIQPETAVVGNLDRFFDIALDMLCISSDDGYFKRLNPAFSRTLGWSIEELLQTPYLELVHPDDVEATAAEVQRQMEAGETVLHFENRYLHKDGSYRILAWKSVPQPGGLMYAVARDVTEERALQKELQEKNSDLEQFSRAVAHDLRGPLRAISGYAELIQLDHAERLPHEAREDLARIVANVRRMTSLIDGLLRFSRAGIQEFDKVEVDTENIAREVILELEEQTKGRRIEYRLEELPVIRGDRDMVKVVFSNLLSNAVKYTREREVARIEIGTCTQGSETIFFVRDNGAGFDMRYVHKLFGIFERIHPVSTYEGNGIGLATVQRIVERHGGRVWAEGEEGVGATFYFTMASR